MIKAAKNKIGKLVSITEVKNGLMCECFCIECNQPLIAKNNGLEKIHHFAHKSDYICTGNSETYLHKIAKIIIQESNIIKLPDNTFHYSQALLEYRHDNIRPDVLLKGDTDLFIEIFVTNKKNNTYYQQLQKLNIDCYEINLSNLSNDSSLEEIKKNVLNTTNNKKKLNINSPQLKEKDNSTKNTLLWFIIIFAIIGSVKFILKNSANKKRRKRPYNVWDY
jgi:competence protein CoiA